MNAVLEDIGFAIVTKNLVYGARDIYAYPIEKLSEYTGDLNDEVIETGDVTDGSKTIRSKVTKKMVIHATRFYDPSGVHKGTVPHVKAGEQVYLYKVRNDDIYYWNCVEYQADLRGKEPTVHVISGNSSELGEPLDETNTHFFKYDPMNKILSLHTANNDGEAVSFDAEFHLSDGVFFIKDSNGNFVKHDGKNGVGEVYFQNRVSLKAPKVYLDGEVFITKDLHVDGDTTIGKNLRVGKKVYDEKGGLTDRT